MPLILRAEGSIEEMYGARNVERNAEMGSRGVGSASGSGIRTGNRGGRKSRFRRWRRLEESEWSASGSGDLDLDGSGGLSESVNVGEGIVGDVVGGEKEGGVKSKDDDTKDSIPCGEDAVGGYTEGSCVEGAPVQEVAAKESLAKDGITSDGLASNTTAPEYLASEEIASESLTLDGLTPERPASHEIAQEVLSSDVPALDDPVLNNSAANSSPSKVLTPDDSTPNSPALECLFLDGLASSDPAPDVPTSNGIAQNGFSSDGHTSDDSASDGSSLGDPTSNDTTLNNPTPNDPAVKSPASHGSTLKGHTPDGPEQDSIDQDGPSSNTYATNNHSHSGITEGGNVQELQARSGPAQTEPAPNEPVENDFADSGHILESLAEDSANVENNAQHVVPADLMDRLWAEGEAFFSIGDFRHGSQRFLEALGHFPNNPPLLDKLSEACHEIGDHASSITYARDAQNFLNDDYKGWRNDAILPAQRDELLERLSTRIEKSLKASKGFYRFKLHRPFICNQRNYILVSNDAAISLFDRELEGANNNVDSQDTLSFLFGGIGDARNLMSTIISIARIGKQPLTNYHFTITDKNKLHLARDLILFMLLERLVVERLTNGTQIFEDSHHETGDDVLEILTTIFFLYLGRLLPRFASEVLLETIEEALKLLNRGHQPLPTFYIHPLQASVYIGILDKWREYFDRDFRSHSDWQDFGSCDASKNLHVGGLPRVFQAEENNYLNFGVLLFSPRLCRKYGMIRSEPTEINQLLGSLGTEWCKNITLDSNYLDNEAQEPVQHNPFHQIGKLVRDETIRYQTGTTLYDLLLPFFENLATSLQILRGRVQIEAIYGESIDIARSIRLGKFRGIDLKPSPTFQSISRRRKFPTSFDRIQLSDDIESCGGCLSVCLSLGPLLKRRFSSHLYLRQEAPKALTTSTDCLKVCLWDRSNPDSKDYHIWNSQALSAGLLRDVSYWQFNNWFYTHFFRLCLPSKWDSPGTSMIGIFHLIQQVCLPNANLESWASEAIQNIIEGSIITTARPRSASVLPPRMDGILHPIRVCTKPYSHEVYLLTRMFSPGFPFLTSESALNPGSPIFKHTFKFQNLSYCKKKYSSAHLVLVFWDSSNFPTLLNFGASSSKTAHNLREILDPNFHIFRDEEDLKNLTEYGLILYTTIFDWNTDTQEASVWMSYNLMDILVAEQWSVGLWSTEHWSPICEPEKLLHTTFKIGEQWKDS